MNSKSQTVQELQETLHQVIDGLCSTIVEQESRIATLETVINAVKEATIDDPINNVREAAGLLRMKPSSVRKARMQGRLKGVKINEKEWGFYKSEIDRYLNRYNRHD